ncbi:MAG: transglycosylase SLT domain-containing protein [Chloroflexota bacterium]
MHTRPRWTFGLRTLLLLLGLALLSATSVRAAAPAPPPGPDRFTVITVDYTATEWWMATYERNKIVCQMVVEHEGPPTIDEVYVLCGEDVGDDWIEQDACTQPIDDCTGLYIFLVDTRLEKKEVAIALPEPTVWLSLEDCDPVSSLATSVCETIPKLLLIGQEPLANQVITRVEGRLNNEPFECEGETCIVELQPTDENGVLVEFWAYSSYGDSTVKLTAQVRVTEADFGNPDHPSWFVDVLSSQWTGQPLASCAETWDVFPPVGGPPGWLSTPNDIRDLASTVPYSYLAENLIRQGVVDASSCPLGGYLPGGAGVNSCGLEAARPAVTEWQNRFDSLILATAQETGVPAQMLKNLFARESQFWPGVVSPTGDTGLGQLTEQGADTTLLWNPSFFDSFCPLVLSQDTCDQGYLHIEPEMQELLRYALVNSVDATCADCPLGLDLNRAEYSVGVFAHTLMANCEQAGMVVRNYTDASPGELITYEDMWKFTLVNYNAGGGCLASALQDASDAGQPLTWDAVSQYLAPACRGAIDYVEDISGN